MKKKKDVKKTRKVDSKKSDLEIESIIEAAAKEARKKVLGKRAYKLGDCYAIWAEQKNILKAQGIDWKSPAEKNPGKLFD